MTLGGILTHLSWVEEFWTTYRLHSRRPAAPWDAVDRESDPDADWHLAAELTGADVRACWTAAVERSRIHVAEAAAAGGLDAVTAVPDERGALSLRWLLVHLTQEYAGHVGHADLLREAVDGQTGEWSTRCSTCATLAGMTTVGLRELRQQASELLRRVEGGEQVLITVAGRPSARLVPAGTRSWRPWADVADLFDGPADPQWTTDRDHLDGSLRDPWELPR